MSDDEQNRMEVILEDINGKFDLVLEGHATLEHMIHEHRAETRQDKRELQALIKTSHDTLDVKIDGVRDELKGDIQGVRDELKETREEMTAGFEMLGDTIENHEQRIQQLERKVA